MWLWGFSLIHLSRPLGSNLYSWPIRWHQAPPCRAGKRSLAQGQPSAFGPIQGRRVEGLTLPISQESFLLTPDFFPENEEISARPPNWLLIGDCWLLIEIYKFCEKWSTETFRDYLLDTGLFLCYVITMSQSESFLSLPFLADNLSTCFFTCLKAFGWKTWAIASSAVISFGCFTIFFMEVSYGS